MVSNKNNKLSIALEDFFLNHLSKIKSMSKNTILSYRDTIKIFLKFICIKKNISLQSIDIDQIDNGIIISFLNNLEEQRENSITTRNIRLAGLHSFFKYFLEKFPEYSRKIQRIMNIPFKKFPIKKDIEYFEYEEIKTILKSINRKKLIGKRDYVLISLMFNTGCRVQEIIQLKTGDITLGRPSSIYIHGKGRKERSCPIWPQTANLLKEYIYERNVDINKSDILFVNYRGEPLSRFGVFYLIKKYAKILLDKHSNYKKKNLHPHSIRHSTAIHLLKSGVDIASIALWLGHESIDTTNKYLKMDMSMKRKILKNLIPFDKKDVTKKRLSKNKNILNWLEAL